ncbi:MAG TPA: L-histidine N(alpha)-methyltransferase [Trichocoleus sp.]
MSLSDFPPVDFSSLSRRSNTLLSQDERKVIESLLLAGSSEAEGQDVIDGLTQSPKSLPPKYFYDDRGSLLFEQITQLPEYYLTRTETVILKDSADAIATLTGPCELVELGSGSATKTRILLDAYQCKGFPLRYLPVDVSGGMLEDSANQLLAQYSGLTVHGLVSTYELALTHLPTPALPARMIAFIGSTLGNLSPLECQQFLGQISQALTPGEYFLLGVDLQKDSAMLEAAYDDSQGITAAFNLNMLHHLNWRFQGNFQPEQFKHVSFYNPVSHQIELYIESLIAQTVTLKALELTVSFAAGERLLSEISRKFNLTTLTQELDQHQLGVIKTFTDKQQWFGLLLCVKR